MKISTNTLEILRNFSTINENLYVQAGNVLRTVSGPNNVMGRAELEEEFPRDFGIYNLKEFLSVLSLVNEPELEFHENYLVVKGGPSKIRYYYTDKDMLSYPPRDLDIPEDDLGFVLTKEDMDKIRSAARAFRYNELVATPCQTDSEKITLSVTDTEYESHCFSIDVVASKPVSSDFHLIWEIDILRFLPGDYEVVVSQKLISAMISQDKNLTYWVALKKKGSYYKELKNVAA